jgi:hypothetical protein
MEEADSSERAHQKYLSKLKEEDSAYGALKRIQNMQFREVDTKLKEYYARMNKCILPY